MFTCRAMKLPRIGPRTTVAAAVTMSAVAFVGLGPLGSGLVLSDSHNQPPRPVPPAVTSTPIKHVVVIFGENISFDHYFGTYPNATNSRGQPFHAAPRHAERQRADRPLLTEQSQTQCQ